MPVATPLTAALGIRHPLLLAPMAGVSGGAMARAVSGAGGLGIIGGGYGDRDWLTRELALAGDAPIGVGFIAWALEKQPALLDLALERAPRAVFLSFGDLARFQPRVARAGTTLIMQVQRVADARAAAAMGADIIVAQGTEAGGHGGVRATMPLVSAVVDAMAELAAAGPSGAAPIPVVAAGGIADGRGMAAALMLGAAGALCGTAFFACAESLAHENAKRAALAGSGDDTERSALFDVARGLDWPAQWTMRTLRNDFTRRWQDGAAALAESLDAERAGIARAFAAHDMSVAPTIVGEAVDMVRAPLPAGALVARMIDETETLLRGAPALLT